MRPKLLCMLTAVALLAVLFSGLGHPSHSSAQGTDFSAIAASQNQFAFDFYQQLRDDNDANLIFSGYSIWQALAMVYAGARGNTEAQMAAALHFDLPQSELHLMIAGLNADIASRSVLPENLTDPTAEAQPLQLDIANGLWGQSGAPFEQAFMDILAQQYRSEMHSVDFFGGSRPTIADEINRWVAEQTQDKITDLVPAEALTENTKLVLANAIYFKGSWITRFFDGATTDTPFYLLDGSEVTVPMMFQSGYFAYSLTDTYTAVELPYFGGTAAMLLIVPANGQFEAVEAGFNQAMFTDLRTPDKMQGGDVHLYVPQFEIETDLNLNNVLIRLGMPDAFDMCTADFTGMAVFPLRSGCENNLYITDALHKAFVEIDEKGTEAAAATTIVMGSGDSIPAVPPRDIRFDRPFIYAIYDKPTGTILFMGRVMNPAE